MNTLIITGYFLLLHGIPNYADDNVPHCTGLKISDVLINLQNAADTLLQWFKDNKMKANPDNYTNEHYQRMIPNKD